MPTLTGHSLFRILSWWNVPFKWLHSSSTLRCRASWRMNSLKPYAHVFNKFLRFVVIVPVLYRWKSILVVGARKALLSCYLNRSVSQIDFPWDAVRVRSHSFRSVAQYVEKPGTLQQLHCLGETLRVAITNGVPTQIQECFGRLCHSGPGISFHPFPT